MVRGGEGRENQQCESAGAWLLLEKQRVPLAGCVLTVVTTTLLLFTNPAFKSTPTPRTNHCFLLSPEPQHWANQPLPLPTLRPRRQVGKAGTSGLDVGGLEGGQDEGHLPAVGRQLGQQVVLRGGPPGAVGLLHGRRHLQRDHLVNKEESQDGDLGDEAERRWSMFTLSLLLLHVPPQQVPAAVFKALHGYGGREVRGQHDWEYLLGIPICHNVQCLFSL